MEKEDRGEALRRYFNERNFDEQRKELAHRAEVLKKIIETQIKSGKITKRILPDKIPKETIKSCVCCDHWKIQKEERMLVGICLKEDKQTDYGHVCEYWEKIKKG